MLFRGCLIIFAILSPSLGQSEQLWRCGQATFTNRPSTQASCSPLQGATLCGNKGAKYYTPARTGLMPRSDECTPSGENSSPFVNLKAAELLAKEKEAQNSSWKRYVPSFLKSEEKPKSGERKFPTQTAKAKETDTRTVNTSNLLSTITTILNGGSFFPPKED